MLLAEIHGKSEVSVRDHEDYLTSTVFGHLRYVRPGPFWTGLFSRAITLPIRGVGESLIQILGEEFEISRYEFVNVYFWPRCPGLGEPELAICFTGGSQRPLVILTEIKLWSAKSGFGEHDQLMRYLRIADSIHLLLPAVPKNPKTVVLYLTPRAAADEVKESLIQYGDSDENRRRLFRVQWQDVIEAIGNSIDQESEATRMILNDVREFLRVRQLEYFRGFRSAPQIERLRRVGSFYRSSLKFHGFQKVSGLEQCAVVKGVWRHDN